MATLKKFAVTVQRVTYSKEVCIEVEASTLREAEQKALDIASGHKFRTSVACVLVQRTEETT